MIDKKERLKRSSNASTTPSTDSSKSSKTFEFFDYDEETKEKVFLDGGQLSPITNFTKNLQVLEEAIKEEDSFLEYVKTLKIEVKPLTNFQFHHLVIVTITGGSDC